MDELYDRLNGNNPPLLVDLRYREHFEGRGQDKYEKNGHIRNAKWIPFMELSSRFQELQKFKNKEKDSPSFQGQDQGGIAIRRLPSPNNNGVRSCIITCSQFSKIE